MIEYRTFSDQLRRVRVEMHDQDIKNGRPGFDGRLVEPTPPGEPVGLTVWGYDRQIVRFIEQ